MKPLWTIIVLMSFTSVLFGSLLLSAHGNPHGSICLASQLNGSEAPCPKADPIGFANFHGEALRKFSNLIIIDGAALMYAIAFLMVVSFGLLFAVSAEKNPAVAVVVSFLDSKFKSSPLRTNSLSWFSLHENSPAFS